MAALKLNLCLISPIRALCRCNVNSSMLLHHRSPLSELPCLFTSSQESLLGRTSYIRVSFRFFASSWRTYLCKTRHTETTTQATAITHHPHRNRPPPHKQPSKPKPPHSAPECLIAHRHPLAHLSPATAASPPSTIPPISRRSLNSHTSSAMHRPHEHRTR